MKKAVWLCFWPVMAAWTQFPPPAGQPGSTAIPMDSSVFIGWAKACTVVRGPKDISNPSLGLTSVGDSTSAVGPAGQNGVVSLGDGGYAILTFDPPIADGPGWDFAVFENAFSDTFLELAFVEVSSNGVDFVRFPATSLTQDSLQIGSFGSLDATLIDNLAGKYRAGYGTPFDLQQLSGIMGLDVMAVTHVKVIDVVGSIDPNYATYDQFGNKVNDPWPTPFDAGGFDLDAVGVIHTATLNTVNSHSQTAFILYPNPANTVLWLQGPKDSQPISVTLFDASGRCYQVSSGVLSHGLRTLFVGHLKPGLYYVKIQSSHHDEVHKVVIGP
jgi:hypothetical protein